MVKCELGMCYVLLCLSSHMFVQSSFSDMFVPVLKQENLINSLSGVVDLLLFYCYSVVLK